MSLDRRDEIVTSPNRYDLTIGSDKSSSLSRSEAGTYDVHQAEARLKAGENGVNHHLNNNNGSPTSPTVNGNGTFSSDDAKKRKWPTEKSYFLAKELQMTERTYKKDLEIVTNHFQEKLSPEQVAQLQPLFQIFDSMLQHHNIMLRDLEHRMVLWEGRGSHDSHRIGDVMLRNMAVLPVYDEYIESHQEILHRVYEMFENDPDFQDIYQEFEQQKICYLPIAYLLLKPMQRLLHYQIILERLVEFYSDSHLDNSDCQGVLNIILRTSNGIREILPESENFILLCELQRDISGFPTLVETNRKLVRQGLLLKHSKRGLQQRMFFLFSDILLYGYKPPISQVFKILGHIPVRSLMTENAEHNTFMIYGGGGEGAITVSAGTTAEKTLWLAELSKATADIKTKPATDNLHGSLKKYSSSEENLEVLGFQSSLMQNGTNTMSAGNTSTLPTKQPSSRSNTALHVCWHRGATVGINDHLVSAENQLSGYLLRKFKNSSGWQKLWVVFTSFCLYFYKSYQDEYALASLPLLGYTVGPPGHLDNVLKEFVFKLSFKNHEYFFRADSIHTYNRWMEVLRSTTQTQDFKNINFHSS